MPNTASQASQVVHRTVQAFEQALREILEKAVDGTREEMGTKEMGEMDRLVREVERACGAFRSISCSSHTLNRSLGKGQSRKRGRSRSRIPDQEPEGEGESEEMEVSIRDLSEGIYDLGVRIWARSNTIQHLFPPPSPHGFSSSDKGGHLLAYCSSRPFFISSDRSYFGWTLIENR